MKMMSLRSVYVSLTALAVVFSLSGCARSTTQPSSETYSTGQSQVREEQPATTGEGKLQPGRTSEMDHAMTESRQADWQDKAGQVGQDISKVGQGISQKVEQGYDKIAASTSDALKGVGLNTGYSQKEKEQFLTGCEQSCAKEKTTNKDINKFCNLYCGCTHDNLEAQVPFKDLQDYTMGKSNKSGKTIEQIRNQCVKSAHTATSKPTSKTNKKS